MPENKTTVKDSDSSPAAQKGEKGRVAPSRYAITEALVRFTEWEVADPPCLKTFADALAWSLFQQAIQHRDSKAIEVIMKAVEGPIGQKIYESRSVVETPSDTEEQPPHFAWMYEVREQPSAVA